MNPDVYVYEYRVIKHAIERGCPEEKITGDLVQHPEHSRFLMEEAKHHSLEDTTKYGAR